jgi:hypothetical protein
MEIGEDRVDQKKEEADNPRADKQQTKEKIVKISADQLFVRPAHLGVIIVLVVVLVLDFNAFEGPNREYYSSVATP